MVFSSIFFLFCFLPVVLALYFALPRLRNAILVAASLVFYAWGEELYVLLMLASIGCNYAMGLLVDRHRGSSRARFALAAAIVANLSLLAWFKYAGFFGAAFFSLIGRGAQTPNIVDGIHLPIGISFFTFQAMSYVIDVYRGVAPVQRNPARVALYISLFPQLIAGPIIRFADIAGDLAKRNVRVGDVAEGIRRFVIGLGKKVLIANVVGRTADSIFAIPVSELTPGLAWLGITSFTLQIYFDFSGYSDMAIGLGRIFGFHFRENFNHPYTSRSLTEFWRRWHISLSSWFRDYLYIPLGGNRRGPLRTYVNLFTVFALCGLWHGASASFLAWGLYHGAFLVLERLVRQRRAVSVPALVSHSYTLLVVVIGWVLFRCDSLALAGSFLAAMAGQASGDGSHFYVSMYAETGFILAFAAGALGSAPVVVRGFGFLQRRLRAVAESPAQPIAWLLEGSALLALVAILAASLLQLSSATHNPFLYFRF